MRFLHRNALFNRRDFIRIGSLVPLGISLGGVLRAEKAKRDVSIILLWQSGGCPHLDTFDMKPGAPSEIRGEFKPIATNVAGIEICELLPLTARQADRFTILRSMHTKEMDHDRAISYLLTGYLPLPTLGFPSMGSVVSKELGPKNGLPPYVVIPDPYLEYGAGYLGAEYGPFVAGNPNVSGYRVRDLVLPADLDWERLGARRTLLQEMDAEFRALEASPEFAAMDRFYQNAYSLLSSTAAKRAFDIESEPPALRERYGRTPVGQGCLLARRLVEAGVRFVTVAKGRLNYDTHGDNFNTLKKNLLPEFDQAYAALLQDLHDRGLLERTLVLVMGEFGRTPKINANAGRDHHSKAWSILLAGGGIAGGRVLGATDKTGTEVTELPVTPEDLLHSLYTILGIDSTHEYHTPVGRPVKIANGGKMIPGLLA
jgi:Protein of unknown function (DUF1501)